MVVVKRKNQFVKKISPAERFLTCALYLNGSTKSVEQAQKRPY